MTHEYSQILRPKGVCGGYSRAWVYAKFLQHRGPCPPPLKRPTGRAAEDRISTRWGHAHGTGDPESTQNNPDEVHAAAVGGYGVVGQG